LAGERVEVGALEQLHREEGQTVGRVAEVEDAHDVRALEARDDRGLAHQPRTELRRRGDLGAQDLERDPGAEHGVVRL
jgi:hypothetical protein